MVPYITVLIGEGANQKAYSCDSNLLVAESGYFASECQRAASRDVYAIAIALTRMTHDMWELIQVIMRKDYSVVSSANVEKLLPWICFLEMSNAMKVFDEKLSMHSDLCSHTNAKGPRILDLFHTTKRYGLKTARKKALNRVLSSIVGTCFRTGGFKYFDRNATKSIAHTLDFSEKILMVDFILGYLHRRSDGSQHWDGGEMATDLVHMILLDTSEPVVQLSHMKLIFCQYLFNGNRVGSNIDGDLIRRRSPIERLQEKILSSIGVDAHSISGITDKAQLVYSYLVTDD